MHAAIVGLAGPALTPDERALLRQRPPLGLILFSRNIIDAAQLSDLVESIRQVVPAALLAVDQEGGRVARLRPPGWQAHPPAAQIGALYRRDRQAGLQAGFLTGALIGLDCASAGFDVVCAPVLDLAVEGASAVIGDRAYDRDPVVVSALAESVARGMLAAGIQPVGKHAPGHGRATLDSHLAMPELDDVDEFDLIPFRALAWLPWMMTAHIRYRAVDPALPATLSPTVLQQVVRQRIGFANLLISDDLAMHAVSGDPGVLAAASLAAGCDVALHCSGVLADSSTVLAAVPDLHPATRLRLEAARLQAATARQVLDGDALAAERAMLLR